MDATLRLANTDHVQAHLLHSLPTHLRLVTSGINLPLFLSSPLLSSFSPLPSPYPFPSALEAEVEKNKALIIRVTALERANGKIEDMETKWKAFQSIYIYIYSLCYVIFHYVMLLSSIYLINIINVIICSTYGGKARSSH